ncbi:MAG: hypothetical protein WD960_07675 [Gemmatimonadota bacterium]
MTPTRPSTAQAAPHSAVLMVLFAIFTALLLGGCARVMDRGAQDSPTPPDVEEADPVEQREEALEPEAAVRATSAMVDEAVLHFAEGRYQTAVSLLTRYLEGANGVQGDEENARAIWGLAMLHLTPDSPTHDPTLGKDFLHRLEEEFPGTTWSTQARWAQGLVGELERVRVEAAEQEILLRQLTETVEQLRRIDLNRRPTGGTADTTRTRRNHLR